MVTAAQTTPHPGNAAAVASEAMGKWSIVDSNKSGKRGEIVMGDELGAKMTATDDNARRVGAPPGNVNAVKHGQRSKRHGLVHAKLGRRFANAYGHANQLRKAVEALVTERHGSLSLLQQAKVQSLLRLEEGIRACEKLIAETPGMDAAEVRQQRYAIAQWTIQRDSLLAALMGDGDGPADPWAALNAGGIPAHAPACPGAADAADGHQADPIQENATATATDAPGGQQA